MENSPVIMSEEATIKLRMALEEIPNMHVLAADSPKMALKGYVSFFQTEGGEESGGIWFGYQFAKPVTKEYWVSTDISEHLKYYMRLGWALCDDLVKNVVGFAKYADTDSEEESEGAFFDLKDVRSECDEETIREYSEYRKVGRVSGSAGLE